MMMSLFESRKDAELARVSKLFEEEGKGTKVYACKSDERDGSTTRFVVEIGPCDELWIDSTVHFEVKLFAGFPKERPQARCTHCAEHIRLDKRLQISVDVPKAPKPAKPSRVKSNEQKCSDLGSEEEASGDSSDSSLSEDESDTLDKIFKSRIDRDGTISCNLLDSVYMGWLELYPLEVLVYTLRLFFRRLDAELAPEGSVTSRDTPYPVFLYSAEHSEQGPRKSMEDRVCAEDYRFVPFGVEKSDICAREPRPMARPSSTTRLAGSDVESDQGSDVAVYDALGGEKRNPPPKDILPDVLSFDNDASVESENGRKISLHAVLDGHGGHKAADMASLWLEDIYFDKLSSKALSVERALYDAVVEVEARLILAAQDEKERKGYIVNTSGTTLCAVSFDLDQGILYCANVGDSRAVLCRADGTALDLSVDDKATRPEHIANVVNVGGFVSHGRVLGMLALSRALGDPEMKIPNPIISATPSMAKVYLQEGDAFVVVACDGVFDVMTSQQVVDFVREGMDDYENDLERINEQLVRHVLGDLRSQDNVSVVIIRIERASSADEAIENVRSFSNSFAFDQSPLAQSEQDESGISSGWDSSITAVDTFVEPPSNSIIGALDGETAAFLSPLVHAAARASRLRKNSSSSGNKPV